MYYNRGAIFLHRKLVEWEWYKDLPTKTIFLHLLLMANWQDQKHQGKVIRRSQRLTSCQHLANETGLTLKQVRTALDKLRSTGEILTTAAYRGLLITIVKYETYQLKSTTLEKTEGTQKAITGRQIKKDNNNNKYATDKSHYTTSNSENSQTTNSAITQNLKESFTLGGWEIIPPVVNSWLREYPSIWIEEAFSVAVKNCGSNPPISYISAVLKNFKTNGKQNEKTTARTPNKSRKAPANSKFSNHPAGAQAQLGSD